MELRHLRYLAAIADAGTFVRAAEVLHVAQPALTRQIHDLEKELGTPLFDPKARRATLTPAGDACARLARHVIHDTEQAVARARLSNSGMIGRCVIAAGPLPVTSGLLPRFIARMRSRFPGITMIVLERAGGAQWDALAHAEADIGFGVEPPASYAGFNMATQVVHTLDRVIVSPDHALARRESVSLRDLKGVPALGLELQAPSIERLHTALKATARSQGWTLSLREFPSIESLIAHVRAGHGWALLPMSFGPLLSGLATVKVLDLEVPLQTMRIWRSSETRPVILTVLDQLKRFQEEGEADAPDDGQSTDDPRQLLPPRVELRHLRSFLAVAKHGSLGRAAEATEITQPALSRQMQELEYDVGVTLLRRETRGVDLTPAGETFRDDAASVLAIVDTITRELRRAERGQTQRCIIAAVPHPVVDAIVPRVMADLEARGQRVRVGLRSIVSVDQPEALRRGDVDISIGHAFPVPKPIERLEHFITVPLVDDRISCVLLPQGHALAQKTGLRARDLADIPFVFVTRDFYPAFYDKVFAAFGAAGLRPRVDGEFEGLTTIWSMVAQGSGWAMGWRSHLAAPPAGLKAVPLTDFDLPWGVVLTYRQDESRAPVLATIDALIQQAAQSLTALASQSGAVQLPSRHTSQVRIP